MKKLEDFVHEHRDEFDSKLPTPELWDKIESTLEEKKHTGFSRIWKITSAVAAVLVIALISTFMLMSKNQQMPVYANISDPEIKQLLETEAYYAREVSNQLQEINKCYDIYPALKQDIESDLNELDNMYKDLENDLNDNLYNKEVIEAMIQNNRTKLKMVNRVLTQVQC
ncbi:MAG: hypothetical protein PF486_08045 [Prolixibacteraceae bacterium]|jgi:hypothetical protein|nr:hypothetical protein [Prolixibacteraceae bacterium]